MTADPADQAQQHINVTRAQWRADELSAFYLRLRGHKVPPAVVYDLLFAEFYPATYEWQDDDG